MNLRGSLAREFKFYLKALGEGVAIIIGRGVTCSDLYFGMITLVALWRKVLGKGKNPNWKRRGSF